LAWSWIPSKVGSASVSLVPRLCSLGAVQIVDRGCVDLFADAVKGGSASVDRGLFDLFAGAVKGG